MAHLRKFEEAEPVTKVVAFPKRKRSKVVSERFAQA